MNSFTRTFTFTMIAVICILSSFVAGYFISVAHPGNDALSMLDESYTIIRNYGYKEVPVGPTLEYGMIYGMVEAYADPFTRFVEPPQAELETDNLQGKFGGIGVRLGNDAQGNYVLFPFADGPAIKAGIQEGDKLIAVDDLLVTSQTPVDTISAAIRGQVGDRVTIKVERENEPGTITIYIKREEISLPTVTWHLDISESRLGIVEVNLIAETTPSEITRAVDDLQARGATAIALDLRNNGGGLLKEGINIARLFLKDGIIVEQQYRDQEIERYSVDQSGTFSNIPLVVLVNENTASAAEIIAGSLQAHDRAKLIGTTTYGKNSIQMVFDLKDGSSLHVTAAQWWIPGLDFPKDGHGLPPDITISSDAESMADPVVSAAVKELFTTCEVQ